MLRLPPVQMHQPDTAEGAFELVNELPEAMYVAGGTDVLVNLKHGLHDAQHLVSLSHLDELRGIELSADGTLRIGAGTAIQTVADSSVVQREVPGLASATSRIAGPQHRRQGTIGGNVLLDTRCLFYNQTEGWRQALGYCLKREGDLCHVINSTKVCVAAHSSDSVPMLMALDASVELITDAGRTTFRLRDAFGQDGRFDRMLAFPRSSLVTAIVIPPRVPGHRSVYRKVRSRGAVDYPQLGVAIAGSLEGDVVTSLDVVLSALMPQPRLLKKLDVVGKALTDDVIDEVAELAFKQAKPQTSIQGDPEWRRMMARVETRRGLVELRG